MSEPSDDLTKYTPFASTLFSVEAFYALRLLLAAALFGGKETHVCDILREAGLGVTFSNGEEHR